MQPQSTPALYKAKAHAASALLDPFGRPAKCQDLSGNTIVWRAKAAIVKNCVDAFVACVSSAACLEAQTAVCAVTSVLQKCDCMEYWTQHMAFLLTVVSPTLQLS